MCAKDAFAVVEVVGVTIDLFPRMHLIHEVLQVVPIYFWLILESFIEDLQLLRSSRLRLYLVLAQNDWPDVSIWVDVSVAAARLSEMTRHRINLFVSLIVLVSLRGVLLRSALEDSQKDLQEFFKINFTRVVIIEVRDDFFELVNR